MKSFLWGRKAWRLLFFSIAASLLAPTISVSTTKIKTQNQVQAASTPIFSNTKSVDVMKYTKDVLANQPSDAAIGNLVSTLAGTGADYIAVSLPMDPSSDYPSGSQPAPNDAYIFTQKWADAIHNTGLHVLWRGTWSGIEGIYSFPLKVGPNRFPAGSAASAATDGNATWLGKTYQYIVGNPSFFKDGDMWAPLPERTEGIFQDSTSFLPYSGAGIQANYATFFNDLKTISDQAFAKIGKNITTGMSANNYTEVLSGWLPQSLFDNNGIVAIDYYGNNHTAAEMDSDLKQMAAMHHHPIFLQEWGDYWNVNLDQATRTQYLQSIYSEMQQLVNAGVLTGFNYWGGWDNNAEGLLYQDATGFHLNYRGQMLSQLYANNPSVTLISTTPPAPAPTPAPAPSATSCPAPATGEFIGCYYTDQNLTNLGLVRQDSSISFNWGGGSPDLSVPADQFSARWEGNFNFNAGDYTFTMTSDDGSRLYIDGQLVLNAWSDHAATTYTVTKTLAAGAHDIKMEYYEAFGGAMAGLSWNQVSSTPAPSPTPTPVTPPSISSCPAAATGAFTGCYYTDQNLGTLGLVRADASINFDWGGGSPASVIPVDRFSARWLGNFNFNSGTYTFSMTSDDGSRLYIDGQLVLNAWNDHPATTYTVSKTLSAGTHIITMEYYEAAGGAVAKLSWYKRKH